MSNIKALKAHELPRVFSLMQAFVKEVGYAPVNQVTFEEFWNALISNNLGDIFYTESGNDIVAILGASFSIDPVSGYRCAAEQFWFVREDHREGSMGRELLNHFENSARFKGCKKILMVGLANSKEDVLPKVYARRGYAPFEQIFMKELN